MTIETGYYVADCTSADLPAFRKDADTFYLPANIAQNAETGIYEYEEYRFNLPITYAIPAELLEYLAVTTDEYRRSLQELGVI